MAGEISASVAHEMNTYIGAALSGSNKLSRTVKKLEEEKIDNKYAETFLEISVFIKKTLNNMSNIVDSLLDFSRKNNEGFNYVDIGEGLNSVLTLLDMKLMNKKVTVHKNCQ